MLSPFPSDYFPISFSTRLSLSLSLFLAPSLCPSLSLSRTFSRDAYFVRGVQKEKQFIAELHTVVGFPGSGVGTFLASYVRQGLQALNSRRRRRRGCRVEPQARSFSYYVDVLGERVSSVSYLCLSPSRPTFLFLPLRSVPSVWFVE